MRVGTQHEIAGGLSGLCRSILKFFFAGLGTFSFLTGVRLSDGRGSDWILRSRLLSFIQDGKAFKELNHTKGAGGFKCCQGCKNVTNPQKQTLEAYSQDDYLVHYTCTDPKKFDKHTPESFWEMIDLLSSQVGRLSPDDLSELELACGIGYDPDSLTFDRGLRSIYNPIQHNMCDPMHVLVASGGVIQFEINEFVRHAIRSEGLKVMDLDAWVAAHVIWRREHQQKHMVGKKRKTFFQDRVVMKPHAHLKAFASETLMALCALVLFFEIVYEPHGIMQEHGKCLKLLQCIVDILFFMGDGAVKCHAQLSALIEQHNTLFLKIYPRKCTEAHVKMSIRHAYIMSLIMHKCKSVCCFIGS